MIDSIIKTVSSINHEIIAKSISTLAIVAAVIIAVKLLNRFLYRWQKRIVDRLERRQFEAISSVETKITISRKIFNMGIYFFGLVILLMQFEAVRNIGAGLLASAGVAGLVIGMAAQNTLSNIIAGISISFAQPVRLNDAVIFENDWGTIEEISLMHTIIRTWDNRRIVVPNNVLSNRVVQNWTIKDPSLLGVVMLYVDYTCDINTIKKWLKEIIDQSTYSTDERVAVVQVVDFTEKTMVVRILGKGPDSPSTWNLRCEIREKLIGKFREAGLPLPLIRIQKQEGEKT
ncbi:MAG: mechanosensitive ion channel [Elusimicrobia bacterium]|nr:mechanosensitive ion channel [Elusimicrobiota bacterium]MBD3411663.1 mechanosensitive ion channel [Elusimicrobiota bacterium]